MAALCWARLLVATMPFSRWSSTLGGKDRSGTANIASGEARRLAAHVDWAATRLPFSIKCLPRAMALSWMLRSKRVDHCVVFAVRPANQRDGDDQLHAWVEIAGEKILGDLPGTWVETLRLGDGPRCND